MSDDPNRLRPVYHGLALREDRHKLPERGGERWKYEPDTDGDKLKLMSDASSAAKNAAEQVWDGFEVDGHMCSWHASNRWWDKNKALFRDWKGNHQKVKDDFENFKSCPHLQLVPIWMAAMLKKWRDDYDEKCMADAWESSWGHRQLTRVEMNHDEPLRGGLPCDNNSVESKNARDKEFRNYARSSAVSFLQQFAEYLHNESQEDLQFVGRMKEDVHSCAFYEMVEKEIMVPHREGKPTCLTLQVSFTSEANGVPSGSMLCCGATFLAAAEQCATNDNVDWSNAAAVRRELTRRTDGSLKPYLDNYRDMVRSPENHGDTPFDTLVKNTFPYRIMRPLPSANSKTKQAICQLHAMLTHNGIPMIPLEELLTRGRRDGLVACDCPTYLRRGWCKHSYASALDRGIILGYPTSMDPRPTTNRATAGCPRNATRGGALLFE
jgi:hypothetical protein